MEGISLRISLNFVSKSRFDAAVTLAALLLVLVAAIIMARTPKASGYEVDIYAAFPAVFWYSLIAAIVLGQIVILRNVFSNEESRRSWLQGLLPILTSNLVLLLIPATRGYPVYGRGDVMSHVGFIKDILREGSIGTANMYPMDHILAVDMALTSGLDIHVVVFMIPLFFSLLYILSFIMLARRVFANRASLLVSLLLIPLLLSGNGQFAFSPFPQSYLMLPFILFLFFRWRFSNRTMRFGALVLFTSVSLVFFHPLTTLVLLVVFVVSDPRTYSRLTVFSTGRSDQGTIHRILLVIIAIFVLWHTYLYLVVQGATHIVDWFGIEGFMAKSEFQSYSDLLGASNPSASYLASYILYQYGQTLILGIASLCCVLLFFLRRPQRVNMRSGFVMVSSSVGFIFFSTLAVAMGMLATIVGLGRMLPIVILFSCILIPASIAYFVSVKGKSTSRRRTLTASLCIMVVLLVFFSTFNLFPSPKTNSANYQVTETEIDGMKSFFETRDTSLGILEFGPSQKRWHDALYGTDSANKNFTLAEGARPIDHFGYNRSNYFGSSNDEPTYFLLSDWGRQFYPEVYPEFEGLWRFSPDDFDRLKTDPSVNLISANGNLEVYLVTPM